MFRVYFLLMILYSMVFASDSGRFIILSQELNEGSIIQSKFEYKSIIKKDNIAKYIHVDIEITKYHNYYILKLGAFEDDNSLAFTYLTLKEYFPKAFIVDIIEPYKIVEPRVKIVEKKVFVDKEVHKEMDYTMWIALFGLAIIGILFMFLSSDHIRRVKEEHEKIKKKHQRLEEKQHEVLSSMGENIHTIAKETMTHTTLLADKVKSTSLEEDMKRVIYNENELLDMTGDLIKFLRLKSKKVEIESEVFNFNNVLNEVSGVLSHSHSKKDIELIFDINRDVPRYMFSDSLHLGQIITNLLEYVIQNTTSKEVKLNIVLISSIKEGLKLKFQIESGMKIENKDALFKSYYDEKLRTYVGLGLFVAKELTILMDGELVIEMIDKEEDYLVLTIPIEEKNRDKRKYRLPNSGLVGKKILLIDSSDNSALAVEKLFSYFKAEVDIVTADKLQRGMPNFSAYEIIILSDKLFNTRIFKELEEAKRDTNLKVISLANLFNTYKMTPNSIIDVTLKKPLTQEYIFDTLIQLYIESDTDKSSNDSVTSNSLPIYIGGFEIINNITIENFNIFRGTHILIVEDNRINQKVVMSMLGQSDMKLSIANNGQEAIEFLEGSEDSVDFIFMDINMPVMDGYTATEKIRENKDFNNIPIVSLTALVSEHEVQKMFDVGMNGYLSKPVKTERLYSALKAFIDSKTFEPVEEDEPSHHVPISFHGLDIEVGLAYTKNNVIFYKEILKEFLDAYSNSDEVFENLVREERYGQVKMLCLDMKGLTGTIGAKEMHVIIKEIYQYLIYNKPELIHSYVDKYKSELAKLKKSIDMYLST
ncbi:MAG: response regulator [Sulfurovum sp.]